MKLYKYNEIIDDIKSEFASCFSISDTEQIDFYLKYLDLNKFVEENVVEIDGLYAYKNEVI